MHLLQKFLNSQEVENEENVVKDLNEKVKEMIGKIFLGSLSEGDNYIYLHPEKWFDIATWLKEEESLFFGFSPMSDGD